MAAMTEIDEVVQSAQLIIGGQANKHLVQYANFLLQGYANKYASDGITTDILSHPEAGQTLPEHWLKLFQIGSLE